MSSRRVTRYVIVAVVSALVASIGCTRGKVVDVGSQPVGGVNVQFKDWPPPSESGAGTPGWEWPESNSYQSAYQVTSISTDANTGYEDEAAGIHPALIYNFAFDGSGGYTNCVDKGTKFQQVAEGTWYRIKYTPDPSDNYRPRVQYVRHQYEDDFELYNFTSDCEMDGSETMDDLAFTVPTVVMRKPTRQRTEKPDLMADPRDLQNHYTQCALMDPSISGDETDVDPLAHSSTVVALRTATGTANVGRGPLRIEQPRAGGQCRDISCPDGFYCNSSGTCSGRSGCEQDSDCPDGVICKELGDNNTACAVPTCSSDADCSSGHCEKSGTCEPYMKALGEPYEISDTHDDCSFDYSSPCSSPRECQMIDGEPECRTTRCSDDSDCESDEACDPSDGVCKALGQTDQTCSSDEQCVSRNCQISSSATGTCRTPTFQKVATMSEFKDDSPTYEAQKVSTSFTFHPAHAHTHLDGFLSLRLVEDTTTCKATRPSYRTSSESQNCTVATNDKVSFCLQDSVEFDAEIRSYANLQPERMWPSSSECTSHHQGISPGYKDVYGANLPGQAVMLGTPSEVQNQFAGSTYLLEQEVDPSDALSERQEKNNWAQASVEFPAFDSGEFCSRNDDGKNVGVIDCREYPDVSSVENDMELSETSRARAICERYAKHYCSDHPTDAICDRYNL